MGLEILRDDPHWVAVNKPAGLATIPGRAESTSLIEELAEQLNLPWTGSADPRLRIVHRLDKETTGVLLLAKDLPTQRHFSHQFQNNLVKKEYLALVHGRPGQSDGLIDAPIAPDLRGSGRMTIHRHGKPARTAWKLEQTYRSHSLIRCFPQTGKTHQIRLHMRLLGCPLAIDPLYTPKPAAQPAGLYLSAIKRHYRPSHKDLERPLIDRLTLHAERLTFLDPQGLEQSILAPLPKDFRAALQQLHRHGRWGSRTRYS
jgi:23S rRNA pseudouridine955/2504/2580 synthase/23S rRNA pseudouridine1911/1915/1917 synthase